MQICFELMDHVHDDQLTVTVQDAHFRFYVHYAVDLSRVERHETQEVRLHLQLWTVQSAYSEVHLVSCSSVGNPLNRHFPNVSTLAYASLTKLKTVGFRTYKKDDVK